MFSSSEGFLKRSSIPSVPINYNKQQKTGKSFIPRFMTKQATIDRIGLKKDAKTRDAKTKDSISRSSTIYSEPLEIESSYIPPKSTKKVEEKLRQKSISLPLSRKSKIPVSTSTTTVSTKQTCTSTPSTKKDNTKTRTSHRNCTSCASNLRRVNSISSIKNTVNNVKNTVKRKSSRVLRCKDDQDNGNVNKDDDVKKPVRKLSQNFFNKKRVSPLRPSTPTLTKSDDLTKNDDLTKSDDLTSTFDSHKEKNDQVLLSSPKSDDLSPTFDSPKEPNDLVLVCSPTLNESNDLSPSHKESNDFVCSPTLTKSDDLFPTIEETNDLVLVCSPSLIKSNDLSPISDSHKEKNDIVISLKIKQISFQKSVNKPEASILITHSNLEVSTTTSIINPELVPISLYCKKETDLTEIKHQYDEDIKESVSEVVAPTMVNNVCKNIVRFGKFISKIKTLV